MDESRGEATLSRRTVLVGMGTAGLLRTGTSVGTTRAQSADSTPRLDAHTRDTYRALVDAIAPRTPGLAASRDAVHEPGALDVGLEAFVVEQLNGIADLRADADGETAVFEVATTVDESTLAGIDDEVRRENVAVATWFLELVNFLSFEGLYGAFESLALEDVSEDPDTRTTTATVVVRTARGTVRRETTAYPLAELLAVTLNVLALGFVASGSHTTRPDATSEQFPAGGAFVRLAPMDRLRCIDWLGSGDALDAAVGDPLSSLLPDPEFTNVLVSGITTLPVLGYYREHAGNGRSVPGETRDGDGRGGDVIGRRQAGYPGFEPGYSGFFGYEVESFRDNDWTTDVASGRDAQSEVSTE